MRGAHPAPCTAQHDKKMELKSLTINLMVADVQRSVDFYSHSLGFEVVTTVPGEQELVFAMIKTGNVSIMLQSMSSFEESNPEFSRTPIGGTVLLYIDVSEIRILYQKVKKAGVPIYREMHDTFYGTSEFTVKDCDGYLLSFAEDKAV